MRTHFEMVREFQQLEWDTVRGWEAAVAEVRMRYDGPTTAKLQELIERRSKKIG